MPAKTVSPPALHCWVSILILAVVAAAGLSGKAHASSVTLAWDANPEPDIASYRVSYGPASGSYNRVVDVSNTTTTTISDLTDGSTYFFAITALNTSGAESLPSNEVSYSPPIIIVNAPPSVSLSSPTSGGRFTAPAIIPLTATAADSDGTIAQVAYFAGATLVATATTPPFTATWSNVPGGSYALTARATDNLGATTTSSAVNISVNAPPTVTLTAPVSGARFTAPAAIPLSVAAADGDGTVAQVAYYAGATLVATTTTAPFSATWSNVPAGNYPMTALATDNLGATTTSSAVNIVVNAPPTVTLTSPTSNGRFIAGTAIPLTVTAADTDGTVTRVDYFAGTTLIATAAAAPFSATWQSVAGGTYEMTAVATDNLGATRTSGSVNITVEAPSATLTSPTSGSNFNGPTQITLSASASFPGGTIGRLEFFAGSTRLGEDATAPYTFVWDDVQPGTYVLSVVAYDGTGQSVRSQDVPITVTRLGVGEKRRLRDGSFEFTVTGAPSRENRIYASTDLKTWTLIKTAINTTGTMVVTDEGAVNSRQQFYRVSAE